MIADSTLDHSFTIVDRLGDPLLCQFHQKLRQQLANQRVEKFCCLFWNCKKVWGIYVLRVTWHILVKSLAKYRLDSNRLSSYYYWFWLLVEVLFKILGLARWLLPLILFESSFYSTARIYLYMSKQSRFLWSQSLIFRSPIALRSFG